MSKQPLYVVRTAETLQKQLKALVPKLEEQGFNVLNAYHIFLGVPIRHQTTNGSNNESVLDGADGLELILTADGKQTGVVQRELMAIFPPSAIIYVGIDLPEYTSKQKTPEHPVLNQV